MTQSLLTEGEFSRLETPEQTIANELGTFDTSIWFAAGWRNDVKSPLSLCAPTNGPPEDVDGTAYWPAVPLSDEDCAVAKRSNITNQINSQQANPTPNSLALDPEAESDTLRQGSAITAKLLDLSNTLDADLDDFDSQVTATKASDDTVSRSRLIVEITDLTPWNGAPNDDIGVKATLITAEGRGADGDELRMQISDSPKGPRGPLPPVQDAINPRKWIVTSELGYMWNDRDASATVYFYWGGGSIINTAPINIPSYGPPNRQNSPIEYGLP